MLSTRFLIVHGGQAHRDDFLCACLYFALQRVATSHPGGFIAKTKTRLALPDVRALVVQAMEL